MNLSLLRTATADDHEAVEALMPLMEPHLEIETYVRVLSRIHEIVFAWERHLEAHAEGIVAVLATDRSRLALLENDLLQLRGSQPSETLFRLPVFESQLQLLGAMYVMEGSRLGGQLIAKHVESCLCLERGHGTRYFRGFEEQTGTMWKAFLGTLQTSFPDESTQEVIVGAKLMFASFESLMSGLRSDVESVRI